MKKNGNDVRTGDYYIGLDVGTNSVGWAVTDRQYNILKFKGNAMWGVRLFEEAKDASARRSSRTARRRLARRNQRLAALQLLFEEEIAKKDPAFFVRLQESGLHCEDKSGSMYSLFADSDFTDREYHKKYPTAYHLRYELLKSEQPHDVRLVFLAIHHIMKKRGHFLYETSESDDGMVSLGSAFVQLNDFLEREYGRKLEPASLDDYIDVLQCSDMGINAKKKAMRLALGVRENDPREINLQAVSDMLAGASVNFSDLFFDEELKKADVRSFSLKNNLDDSFDTLADILGERVELLVQLKQVFDSARLSQILSGYSGISEAKIALYHKNKQDITLLKRYVRMAAPEKYKRIFSKREGKLNNFPAYNGYQAKSGDYSCTQEDFCKFLKNELPVPNETDAEINRLFREIQDGNFLSKLSGSDNGVIPYQLHKQELIQILDHAAGYLPFLSETGSDGLSVCDKIIKLFEFRIPYYVGPLNSASPNYWAVRFEGQEHEKIYPWNFDSIINREASAENFMTNLIGRCSYTGEPVLPKDSLLYSEYMMLNEINLLRVNGKPLPEMIREGLIQRFFYESRRKVTKKDIRSWLLSEGLITASDEISGIDDVIKSSLRSWHDFHEILNRTGDYTMVESIIRSILVMGEDKRMLRRWLKKNTHDLTEKDIKHICKLKYSDWGRLSDVLLTQIRSKDQTGEEKTIMELLRESNQNLMQLMSSDYDFAREAQIHREKLFGSGQSLTEKLDSMYIAPAVRRSIRQALRIVDEIVDIKKAAPAKIFIEMARGSREDMKNKRTESRKDKLIELYRACKADSDILFKKLENEDENRLRSDKLYLYYMQQGRCMYSGEPIDLESLLRGEKYDIDHIFPRSRIKDNSIDNRVLVKNTLNREKTNIYPIDAGIRNAMMDTWLWMKKAGLISQKKFDRLSRNYPLTEKELSDFVARQLTETQQSTKALTVLLQNVYTGSKIVFSKAGNVSDFRHDYGMVKCRQVNDLHHAKDAYLNIVVGNVYDTKFTARFFANIHNEEYSLNRVFDYSTPGAWDKNESIKTVKRYMAKNNVLVTRMPREVKGQLFDLQLMSAGKGQLPKKAGLSVEKYGGYNKLTGAYFCVVEYKDKKKRVRALQPVYVYQKELYERDPIRYCTEILGLNEPVIIAPVIRTDALVELDGARLLLSSRTGGNLIYKHTYQLAIDGDHENYIRKLEKYVERCAVRRMELPVTKHDGISERENGELYDWFIERCGHKVYAEFTKNMRKDMLDNRAVFDAMSVLEQSKLLLEILKAFKCNAQNPDFSALCKKKTVARISKSMNLGNFESAYLINQSVTGLYETRIDLLR